MNTPRYQSPPSQAATAPAPAVLTAAIDASVAWLLSRPGSGDIFIPGRVIRHALGMQLGQQAIDACVPQLLEETDVKDRYCITLTGILRATDERPRRVLGAALEVIGNRYRLGQLDQRIVLWSDIRSRGGLRQEDFEIGWHTILAAKVARGGGHVQGERNPSHPQYDYDFWLNEHDLEDIAHNATVEDWIALQASRHPLPTHTRNNKPASTSGSLAPQTGAPSMAATLHQLVDELQHHAQSGTTDLGELLRRAKTIATKLRAGDALTWIDREIKGYPADATVPTYRIIPSELRVQNPFHGWKPVIWDGASDMQKHFDSTEIRAPIAEVVEIALAKSDGEPHASLHQSELDALIPNNPDIGRLPTARVFSRANFVRIIDNVRTRVLEWALSLDDTRTTPLHATERTKETSMKRTLPSMFIGSTVEALPVARAVQKEMDHELEITIWNQNLLAPGTSTWIELVQQARSAKFDLALLVLGGEDTVTSRGATVNAPRDNILLELGLFSGALGADRAFFLYDRDNKPKLASDLAGITALTYSGSRSDQNLHAAVGAACDHIREQIRRITQTRGD